ncbi:MAG: VOC family protein [Betaproteobacteria bacterium]
MRIDHIGIIVSDLELAVQKFKPLFGEPVLKELDVGLQVAEFHAENIIVELLQYKGEARFARETMGERVGLNHISIGVDDLEAAMKSLPFKPKPGFPCQGAHGRIAFFEPDATTGLLFELCQED